MGRGHLSLSCLASPERKEERKFPSRKCLLPWELPVKLPAWLFHAGEGEMRFKKQKIPTTTRGWRLIPGLRVNIFFFSKCLDLLARSRGSGEPDPACFEPPEGFI